jgi:carbonic anhydrase
MHGTSWIIAAALPIATVVWICSGATAQAAGAQAQGANASAPGPAAALARLMAGNRRFQSGAMRHPGQDSERRDALTGSQSPFAVILSCSDSRVPPEIIFDQGLGDLFVVRVAGNTVTRTGMESIEYAVEQLSTRLIVVLGHDSCGAVKGAVQECPLEGKRPPAALPAMLANICPAVDRARKAGADIVSEAIDLNVTDQVALLKRSPAFEKRVRNGSLMIVGGRYDLRTGKVRILPSDN